MPDLSRDGGAASSALPQELRALASPPLPPPEGWGLRFALPAFTNVVHQPGSCSGTGMPWYGMPVVAHDACEPSAVIPSTTAGAEVEERGFPFLQSAAILRGGHEPSNMPIHEIQRQRQEVHGDERES